MSRMMDLTADRRNRKFSFYQIKDDCSYRFISDMSVDLSKNYRGNLQRSFNKLSQKIKRQYYVLA